MGEKAGTEGLSEGEEHENGGRRRYLIQIALSSPAVQAQRDEVI